MEENYIKESVTIIIILIFNNFLGWQHVRMSILWFDCLLEKIPNIKILKFCIVEIIFFWCPLSSCFKLLK